MLRLSLMMVLACGVLVPQAATAGAEAGRAAVDGQKPAALNRGEARSAAEVQRLKQDVARQEARSREADRRLHEQDLALERLRQALRAAQEHPEAATPGT